MAAASNMQKFCFHRNLFLSSLHRYNIRQCSNVTAGNAEASAEDIQEVENAPRHLIRLKPHVYNQLKKIPPYDLIGDRVAKTKTIKRISPHFSQKNFDKKMYGGYGKKSGVNPAVAWPTGQDLERELAKHEFFKPVEERIRDLRAEKQQEKEELQQHNQHIASRMAKMDEYIAQYEQRKQKRFQKDTAHLQQREALLEEAREFFGYTIDHKDDKFRQMVEWKEEQAKKAKKKAKRFAKDNTLAIQVARITSASNTTEGDKS